MRSEIIENILDPKPAQLLKQTSSVEEIIKALPFLVSRIHTYNNLKYWILN